MDKDLKRFIEKVYKLFAIMGVSSIKKVDLVSYQLKDVTQILYEQLKDSWMVREGRIEWEIIMLEFLDTFFP